MTFDWVEWQLELDRLQAEAAELADKVCRTLAEKDNNPLQRALDFHQQWMAVDQQVATHMENGKRQRSRG